MNIVRKNLSGSERRAIGDILSRTDDIRPLATFKSSTSTMYRAVPKSASEVAHQLCFEDQPGFSALSELGTFLQNFSDQLPEKRQVLIIENLPIQTNPGALLLLIGSMIGEVHEYIGHGTRVIEVSDKGQIVCGRPSSDNNLEFRLHTDMSYYPNPPSLVLFLMLSHGATGGESIFCDPRPVLERLSPQAIAMLQQPFRFPAPPHRLDMGTQLFPILRFTGEATFYVRFRRDGLEALGELQSEALAEWEKAIDTAAIEFPLAPCEMAIFSNTQLLHGRRAYRDAHEANHVRCGLRAYVECPDKKTISCLVSTWRQSRYGA